MALLFMKLPVAFAVAFAVSCFLQGCGGKDDDKKKDICDNEGATKLLKDYQTEFETCKDKTEKTEKANCCALFAKMDTDSKAKMGKCTEEQKKTFEDSKKEARENHKTSCPDSTVLASITDAADDLPVQHIFVRTNTEHLVAFLLSALAVVAAIAALFSCARTSKARELHGQNAQTELSLRPSVTLP